MRTLFISALAASLAGCSHHLPSQTADASGISGNVSSNARSAITRTNSGTTAKTKKRPSAHAFENTHAGKGAAKASRIAAAPRSLDPRLSASNAAADSPATPASISDSHRAGEAVANSNTRTIQEQVAAATAVAERMTVATLVPALERPETPPQVGGEKTAAAQPRKMDPLVYLLVARPEIKSVSDLTSKIVAINDGQSGFGANVRIAIAAAGAPQVQLSNSQTKAIDRVISGEAAAAVLTAVSPDAAEGFPDIRGYKIFRIPLVPRP